MHKKYDIDRLKQDLKACIGIDGLTKKHLKMNDEALLNEYAYVYGEEELDQYLIEEKE